MTIKPPLPLLALLAALVATPAMGLDSGDEQEEPTAETAAQAPPFDLEAWRGQRDDRGWHLRQGSVDAAALLAAGEPQPVELPAFVVEKIQRRTVLIYISPSCPHCVTVLPELSSLALRVADHADVLLVFSGYADLGDAKSFASRQQLPFPWVHDGDRSFALATGFDTTPSLLVVDPPEDEGSHELEVLDAYMPYVHGADAIVEMRLLGDSESVLARGDWLGAVTCGACHLEETRSYSMTLHSVAYYHLVDAGGVDDGSCLDCHVTNPLPAWSPGQEPGEAGFRQGDHRSPFANVTCESCHTASGPHDGDGGQPREACTRCHAPDHVPFELEVALPHVDHFAGGGVTDGQMQAWRSLVAVGEVERPLATMPSSATTGAKACGSCHKPQLRQWRKTPHAKAMHLLEEEGHDKVTCVVCHATPVDSSVPVDSVEGFRTDESVGCELCHGPGQAHAEDPAANPMWTLKTRVEPCFVEGVCTRCHNEIRDDDFDVRWALREVAH